MAFIKISRDEVIRGGAHCIKQSSMLCTPLDQIGKNKWARLVEDIGKRSAYRFLARKRDGKKQGRGSRRRLERNIKMNLREICEGVYWIDLLRIGASGRFLCRR
jgi:hypothetical protein